MLGRCGGAFGSGLAPRHTSRPADGALGGRLAGHRRTPATTGRLTLVVSAAPAAAGGVVVLEKPPSKAVPEDDPVTLQLQDIKHLPQLQLLVANKGASFGLHHFSAAITKAMQLSDSTRVAPGYSMLQQLGATWLKLLPEASVATCAEVLSACARLPLRQEQIWLDTLAHVNKKTKQLTTSSTGSLLHSLAKVAEANASNVPGVGAAELKATFSSLMSKLQELSKADGDKHTAAAAQNYSRALWACAKAGYQPEGPQLKELLSAAVAPPVLKTVTAQDVHDLVWALAVLQHLPGWTGPVPADFWKAMLSQSMLRLAAKDSQRLPELLHSLARLKLTGAAPAAAASNAAMALIQSRTGRSAWAPRDVAVAMMACGVLGVGRGGFLAAASAEAAAWGPGVCAASISRTALAVAAARLPRQQLMERLLTEAAPLVRNMAEQDRATHVACLAWTVSSSNSSLLVPKLLEVVRVARMGAIPLKQLSAPCLAHLGAAHEWLLGQRGFAGKGLLGPLTGEQIAAATAELERCHGQVAHPCLLLFERTTLKHACCGALCEL